MNKIKVMINGLPGNVAQIITKHAIADERIEVLPYAMTGPEIDFSHCHIGDLAIDGTADLGQFNYRLHNVHEVGDVYDSSQHHWIAALQGRVALLPTAAVALNTMLISEGIFLSEKLDREVTADEVLEMSKSTAVKL
jgi:hypothetical protein